MGKMMDIVKDIKNKDYLISSKYMLANSALSFVFKMLSSILVVRYIGTVNNGVYSYIYAVSTIFLSVADFGLESLIVREGTVKKYEPKIILGSAVAMRLVTALIAAILFLLYIYSRGYDKKYIICSFWVSLSYVSQLFYAFKAYMISQYKVKDFYIYQNICIVFFFILRIVFACCKLDFVFIFIINTLEGCVSGIIYYVIYGRKHGFALGFSSRVFRMYLKEGILLTVASISVLIYMRCDQIMVRGILGENALGLYSVAVLLAEFWYFVPSAINSSFSPRVISILQSGNEKDIEKFYGAYYRMMFLLSIGAVFVISLFSKILVTSFYGPEYEKSADILIIYIWAGVFVCLGLARSNYLIYKKYNVFNATVTVIACIINVGLNYLLIPNLYGIGAALSTIVSYFFSAMFSSLLWSKTRANGLVQFKALFYPYLFKYYKSQKESQNMI